jgi:four helix bundle protein
LKNIEVGSLVYVCLLQVELIKIPTLPEHLPLKQTTMTYSFETLDVWKYSRELTRRVYSITARFPQEEKYVLTSQLRRACISVCSNIAEGSARWSKKEKARYYEMAFGSLMEVLNQVIIGSDLHYVNDGDLEGLRERIDRIGRMLNSLYSAAINAVGSERRAKKRKVKSERSS